jgi:hypothetical protein
VTAGDPTEPTNTGLLGTVVFGASAATLGALEGLPFALGAVIAGLGVAGSVAWRESSRPRGTAWTVLPALLALSVDLVLARSTPTTELLAGATGVAFLFWVADDPSRPDGGSRRASIPAALVAVAIGFSLVIVLVLPQQTSDVGVAGGLLAVALVLLAVLLTRSRLHGPSV